MTYPSAAATAIGYGDPGSEADKLSRPDTLALAGADEVSYRYLGLSTFVGVNYLGISPSDPVLMTYEDGPASTVAPGGDKYSGLDAFGRVVETKWKKGSSVKQEVNYGYDRASNRTWRRNELAHDDNGAEKDKHDNFYGYDGLYQVIERQLGNLTGTAPNYSGITNKQQDEDWCYDETGNWQKYDKESPSNLEQTRTHNQANEICSVANPGGVVQPAYDPVGNQTVDIAPGDWTKQYDLTWDAWNRLVKVEDNATAIQTNAYDGLTRRITSKDQNNNITHYYYNDQWRAVEEYKNSETSPDRRYLWGLRSRWDLVKRLRDAAGDLDEKRYVLYDAMDPVAICDETGAVKLRFEYSPFGQVTFMDEDFVPISPSSGSSSSSSSSSETPESWNWLFHGEFRDETTGYYNYGYRYYNDTTGRWVSRDPIGEQEEPNLYEFVKNNCVTTRDFLGLKVRFMTGGVLTNKSSKNVWVQGDAVEIEYTHGGNHRTKWPKLQSTLKWYRKHRTLTSEKDIVIKDYHVGPGDSSFDKDEDVKSPVDTDFLTRYDAKGIFTDKKCDTPLKLPKKIGANFVSVRDCPDKKDCIYYTKKN